MVEAAPDLFEDPATSFMQPRDDKGVFIKDFKADDYTPHICESNGWQYFWSVQHDVDGLVNLVGGKNRFAEKLEIKPGMQLKKDVENCLAYSKGEPLLYFSVYDELETLVSQKEAAEKAQKEAEEKIAAMESEMDELRMQAEQTALPDESELERIRREAENTAQKKAEEAMQKKLDKAKKDGLRLKVTTLH